MGSTNRAKAQPPANFSTAEQIRSYAQRVLNLEEERKVLASDIKDIKNEAASQGIDKKALMIVVARMRETEDQKAARIDAESIADVYLASLGMLDGTPLGEAARRRFDEPEEREDDDEPPTGVDAGAEGSAEPTLPPHPPAGLMGEAEISQAREAGSAAAGAGTKIFANPYAAGDPRRAAWDEGWCARKGSDGMEIPEAFRRKVKPKKTDESAGQGGEA
ncbi:GapR family DNA-binding domain-containing protein [Methylobacterium sp. CCH5-D2]|uniref:DUF2312 domain-containing protein n=1 Tax=Methylobacterium sp. CCH5-D2 TaxID=1768765 RepID=UPI00082CD05D|nr:GapR family DNA-binding domain-containing protein [Methylobacterium sp. CCH5-D2]